MRRRDQKRSTLIARSCAVLIALIAVFAAAKTADAGTIWIEWDRSAEPAVVGYRVSVGTSPGVYTETFDVGSATSFVYQARDNSRLYYLAVASYAAGPLVGPLSPPVSALPRPAPSDTLPSQVTDARSFYGSLWSSPATVGSAGIASANTSRSFFRGAGPAAETSTACWTPSTDCLEVRTLARRTAEIASLSASHDGRLFFIEDGQRIRVVASNQLQPRAAVTAANGVRLTQIELDSQLASSGVMHVGETETYGDGSREFRVARYRLAQNQALYRQVIVSMPLPFPSGEAVFAVGSSGHIYVAMPAAASAAQRTAHSSMLLRFNADGTIPDEQEGSAVFATGYGRPTAIAVDTHTLRLWLAGVDDLDRPSVSSLGESTSSLSAPAASLAASADAIGGSYLYVATAAGGFGRALVDADGSLASTWQLTLGEGMVRSVAVGPSGELFVAVAFPFDTGTTTSILRLTPLR